MENQSERRKYERYDYQTTVFLCGSDSQEEYCDAKMYNYSMGGTYLRTNEKLNVGQYVYVRNYYQDPEKSKKYESYSGYVRWSNKPGKSSPGGQFGYGVEYMQPVYE